MGKNERGWILIDALIGMVIVAIALTALAVAYRQATVVTVSANNQATAVWVAQQMVETIKQQDAVAHAQFNPSLNVPSSVTLDNKVFSIDTPVELSDPEVSALSPRLRPVRVTVRWTEPNGEHSISVVSYYYCK